MGKLHELLAVEKDVENVAKNIMQETYVVFNKKPALFLGSHRKYQPFVDDDVNYPEEHQALTTTVPEKLDYMMRVVSLYYDVMLQKEMTNQEAKADLVIDGMILATDLPATFLLGLESRLRSLREVLAATPTLNVGIEWRKAEDKGKHVWATMHPEETLKTQRTTKSKVLYEATEHHPAQIDKWEETEAVGKYIKHVWSGMISPADKSDLLDRMDKLIMATKQARQRANSTEVTKVNIGNKIAQYLAG